MTALPSVDGLRVDRQVQPFDILRAASKACAELAEAIDEENPDAIIAAERRLVAVGGLAQASANRIEATL